jgi:hypothetical protein
MLKLLLFSKLVGERARASHNEAVDARAPRKEASAKVLYCIVQWSIIQNIQRYINLFVFTCKLAFNSICLKILALGPLESY